MKVLAALLTILALVGALVLDLAYLYPILGAIALGLVLVLKLDHLFFAGLLLSEGFVFGLLGYGANDFFGLRIGYSDLLLLSLGITVIVRLIYNRGELASYRTQLTLFIVWILLYTFSVLLHPELLESGLAKWQLFCIDPFLIFLVGIRALDCQERVEQAVLALTLAALPLGIMIASNWLSTGISTEESLLDADALREATAEGTYMFRNKNISGAIFAALAPLFVGVAWTYRGWLPRLLGLAALAVSLTVVALSLSRGSILALSVGFLLLGSLTARSRTAFILSSAVVGGLALLTLEAVGLLAPILERFEGGFDLNRAELFRASLGMIADYPLTGIGMSEFRFLDLVAYYSGSDVNLVHPHNSFLQMVVFGGLPLLAGFLVLLTSLLRNGPLAEPYTAARRFQVASLASVLVFLLNMLTDFVYFNSISCFVFWILLTIHVSHAHLLRGQAVVADAAPVGAGKA
jgi:O-antigen ligase